MRSAVAAWILMVALIIMGAGPAMAQNLCQPQKAPTIVIKPVETQTRFDNSRSFLALSKMHSDTVSPYESDAILHTFGMAATNFKMNWNISYNGQANRFGGQGCLWYDVIDFKITMSPVIYMASEYPSNSCQYKEVMKHEKMHLATDRKVINKYMQILGKRLFDAMGQQYIYGPIALTQKDQTFEAMAERISGIVNQLNTEMQTERQAMQAQVDSLQNYEGTAKIIREVCDKQFPNVAKARDYQMQRYYTALKKGRKI